MFLLIMEGHLHFYIYLNNRTLNMVTTTLHLKLLGEGEDEFAVDSGKAFQSSTTWF